MIINDEHLCHFRQSVSDALRLVRKLLGSPRTESEWGRVSARHGHYSEVPMPKRAIFFLVAFLLIIGCAVGFPFLERADMESKSVNSSLSASPYGYKALYLLLEELYNQPVELWEHSMMLLPTDEPKTIWFAEPGKGLFFDGKEYSEHMYNLVFNGYNFVFILNYDTLLYQMEGEAEAEEAEAKSIDVVKYLNDWYPLSIDFASMDVPEENLYPVISHFVNRTVKSLSYKKPQVKSSFKLKFQMLNPENEDKIPTMLTINSYNRSNSKLLLALHEGQPLAVRFFIGKGSVTVIPDSFLFQNGQLNRGDNAPLAMAIQDELPKNQPVLFEIHSSGFKPNRNIISYLASGKGVAFLVSTLLLFGCFSVWLISQPVRRVESLKTSDERYFTQEIFIDAMAQHYLDSQRWEELYKKLLYYFESELSERYPVHTHEERLRAIAQNPFYEVSLKELEELFVPLSSEEEFTRKSRSLLEVQRRIQMDEQHRIPARTNTTL